MGASQRRKGTVAERELVRLLRDELGDGVMRNLDQTRDGGCDLIGVGPFAVEVKRAERLALSGWWSQAASQAACMKLVPALAYRQSRQPWAVLVPLTWLIGDPEWQVWDDRATLTLPGFCYVVRECCMETA